MLTLLAWTMQAQESRYSNLPTIRINTLDGWPVTSKSTYKLCTLSYTDENSVTTVYDSVQIRGRGNSTWNLAKKPYRIKFKSKEKFLGKGYAKAKSWTLIANAGDKTMMRDAVASALGEFMGMDFNPAYKFVDLELNGSYLGTYQISDQIDVRPHRVNIYEQEEAITDTTDITGGYLLEVDGFADFTWNKDGFYTNHYVPVRVHSPDEDIIDSRQLNYIWNYVNEFERRLYAGNYDDPAQSYRSMVDTVSLVNWYLGVEIPANVDGFYSTYFYKDRDDSLLYWGPMWDYDIAFNNDSRTDRGGTYQSNTTEQLMADVAYSGSKGWVNEMWKDTWFQKRVNSRFKQLVDEGVETYLNQVIDSLSNLLQASQELNYEKWGISKRMYHERVLYSSYDQYVTDLKTFINQHLTYLATAFAQRKPAEPTPPFKPEAYFYRIYSRATDHPMDISGTSVVTNADDPQKTLQDWYVKPVGDYFQIINRSNSLAINDPTTGNPTATTNTGAHLNLAVADSTDQHQLWTITGVGTDGSYNLINAFSQHTADLSGGSSNENTPVLSWTNDSRNSDSQNRMWYFEKTDPLTDEFTAISRVAEPENYALAYNPTDKQLHFGTDDASKLTFTATVYNLSGVKVGEFAASSCFDMSSLPDGIYIVKWLNRSVKFRK